MNYKVLYRKYRPENFENIIAQDYTIETLKNSIIHNNISHAYIFSGPRGTGKTSTAKVFAKAINCLNPKNGSPCEKCEYCKNSLENPDIIEIDAASNNGVDEIRNLIDNVKLAPSNGKYKVYIIDEVHMLTTSAFNALLLTLEEPPSHVVFILATTNIENVPMTILSRCQRFDFKKIDVDSITKYLKNICKKEKIDIDDEALDEIAYLSDGAMRDSLSLLDQLSKSDEKITLDYVENKIKIISQNSVNLLLDIIENNDIDGFLNQLNEYKNRSTDYKTLVKKLIFQASIRAKNIKLTGKINRLNFDSYKKLIIELSDSLLKNNINVDNYIILEMIILNYFEIGKTQKLANEGKKTEKNVVSSVDDVKKTDNKQNFVETRVNNCFAQAKKEELEKVKQIFSDLEKSTKVSGQIKGLLLDSIPVAASESYIIMSCENDHVADSYNIRTKEIESDINKKINKNFKLVFISNKKWNEEKQKYIKNVKSNKKYLLKEEVELEKEKEDDMPDVFNKDKLEII